MSKYTTEVRFICETEAGYSENQGASNIDAVIEKAGAKFSVIFLSMMKSIEKSCVARF